jgi:hypothetical protein
VRQDRFVATVGYLTSSGAPYLLKPNESGSELDVPRFKGNRILSIDLSNTSSSPEFGVPRSGKQIQEILNDLVHTDLTTKPSSERIDSVYVSFSFSYESTPEAYSRWDSDSDDLSPKHWSITALLDEACNLHHLNALEHQWTDLESLTLTYVCDYVKPEEIAQVLSGISSLTMNFCCSANLSPLGADGVATMLRDSPRLWKFWTLKVPMDAHLRFTNRKTSDRGSYFVRIFGNCFWWSAITMKNLASFIPNAGERLSLQFTRSIPFLWDMEDCQFDTT